jgi:hypothetical protein
VKKLVVPVLLCAVTMLATAVWMQAQQKSAFGTNDFLDLQRLLWRNHWGYDFADQDNAEMWLSSFTPDAVLDSGAGQPITGVENIRQFALRQFRTNPDSKTRHYTSTFNMTPNAEGAVLSALYFIVMKDLKTGAMQLSRTGYYESQAVRTKDGWKIKHHIVHLEGELTALKEPSWVAGPGEIRPSLRYGK